MEQPIRYELIKKDEAKILSYFRLLNKQNKEKIAKEILDLYEKQF